MEWMKGPSCQATESGNSSPLSHTHLDNTAFIWKCHFLCFKGGFPPCVSVSMCLCVCFSWMPTTQGLSPTWFFQKLNWLQRVAIWPLSLFPSFAPLRDFYSFMYLSNAANYHSCQGTCTDVQSYTHTHIFSCIFVRTLIDLMHSLTPSLNIISKSEPQP